MKNHEIQVVEAVEQALGSVTALASRADGIEDAPTVEAVDHAVSAVANWAMGKLSGIESDQADDLRQRVSAAVA